MELTKERIRKVAQEAIIIADDAYRAAYPNASTTMMVPHLLEGAAMRAAVVIAPVAAALVSAMLKEQHGEDAIIKALLGE